ncbi:hypothetical protein ASD42_21555, partial [Nocardia sp. Root136]
MGTMAGSTGHGTTGWPALLANADRGKLQLLNVDGATLKSLTTACEDHVADILGLANGIEA